jgi:lysophospholipase L1-like esterase
MALKIQSGKTLLFVGDSITDCGRRGTERPLGNGYVKMFNDMLIAREPAKRIHIINKGIGGDRVTGLRDRWTDDVLRHKPNWLSVKIGINDLHSHLNDPVKGVSPKVYEEAYDNILGRTVDALPKCEILLIDPFYITTERSPKTWRHTITELLPTYIGIVHKMSKKYGTRLVRTHDMFQTLLKHYEADTFCAEPVHPNATGHLAIAEAVYEAFSK